MVGEDPNSEPASAWPNIEAYFAAAKPVIEGAGFRLGDYGSEAAVNDLASKGLVSRKWFVGGWSQDISADLIQQSNTPGASTFGGAVDCNYAPAADWGWTEFGGASPPIPAPPPPAPVPVGIAEDGIFGPQTIRALQARIGCTPDGIYGPDTRRHLQSHLGVQVDGIVGPITIRALQARVGAAQDGIWGPDTTRHLQHALNTGAF
jgi:peptidoglycan hydrolase-like protein with peptidoglycan-binding domain